MANRITDVTGGELAQRVTRISREAPSFCEQPAQHKQFHKHSELPSAGAGQGSRTRKNCLGSVNGVRLNGETAPGTLVYSPVTTGAACNVPPPGQVKVSVPLS